MQNYLNAQRVTTGEAAWASLKFDINHRSLAVRRVNVHTPGDNWVAFDGFDDICDEQSHREAVAQFAVSAQVRYFRRPVDLPGSAVFDRLTITEYYEQFLLCKPGCEPAYARGLGSTRLDQLEGPQQRCVYLRQRSGRPGISCRSCSRAGRVNAACGVCRPRPAVHVRLVQQSAARGAVFYLRQLLRARLWRCSAAICAPGAGCSGTDACRGTRDVSRQPRGYADLLTGPSGAVHLTYEAAAHEYGLLAGMDAYTVMFREEAAGLVYSGRQLTQLFVLCLSSTEEFAGATLWAEYRDRMSEDEYTARVRAHPRAGDANRRAARDGTLRDIAASLRLLGMTLADFGLPAVEAGSGAVSQYEDDHPPGDYLAAAAPAARSPRAWDDGLQRWEPVGAGCCGGRCSCCSAMTVEQKPVYDRVVAQLASDHGQPVSQRHGQCTALTARAGRGKTWLMNLIVADARSKGMVVLCVASTALGAGLYPGGRTAHSQFGIPVVQGRRVLHTPVLCDVAEDSDQAALLRTVDLLVWDEVFNSHSCDIAAVDALLRKLCQSPRPFGGKVVLVGGDIRQIPPVVLGGTEASVCAAMLCEHRLWRAFVNVELQRPVRDVADAEYSAYVDSLGDGTAAVHPTAVGEGGAPLVQLPPFVQHTSDPDALVDAVFPDLRRLRDEPERYHARAILATTNSAVRAFNARVVERMAPAGLRTLVSHDCMDSADDGPEAAPREPVHREVIDLLGHRPGVPLHELQLFPRAMCMVMRNLDPRRGLVNSAKCAVVAVDRHVIQVRLLGAAVGSDPLLIPRISFTQRLDVKEPRSPVLKRMQYPLQLCYSITVNKSQGQTLEYVGLDFRADSFSHGQTYVGFGRVGGRSRVCVLLPETRVVCTVPALRNVVYHRLLRHLRPPASGAGAARRVVRG